MSTGRTTLNDDFKRMWKEVIMAYFKEFFLNLYGGDWENLGKPGSIAVSNWESSLKSPKYKQEFSILNYFPFFWLNYRFLPVLLTNPSISSSDIQHFFPYEICLEIFWHVMLRWLPFCLTFNNPLFILWLSCSCLTLHTSFFVFPFLLSHLFVLS